MCSEGRRQVSGGIRAGDSGGALNFKENKRFTTIEFLICSYCHIYLYFYILLFVRFSVIGVNSFIHPEFPEIVPDVYAKITPTIKKWIKRIVTDAQDSSC